RVQAGPDPILVDHILDQGELRTVKVRTVQVVDHASRAEVGGPLGMVPLVNLAVGRLTENRALVTVRGTVEAGVDLSRVRVVERSGGLDLVLPPVTWSEPAVEGRLHSVRQPWYWRDHSVALSAVESGRRSLMSAQDRVRLERRAAENAERAILELLSRSGVDVEKVRVLSSDSA
ncbi:MAG: DUF4230 domain-containing protein, partial [Fimbriimonadaceae bacterium]|nr:DUF4230 domain-containing protein [Fimbriimonadaceae bacterium]